MQVDILFCLSTITKLKKMISRRHLKRLVKQEKENIIKKIWKMYKKNVNNVQTNNSDNEIIWSEDITVPIKPEENNLSLSEKLKQYYIKYSPSRKSFDALLKILKEENLNVPHLVMH